MENNFWKNSKDVLDDFELLSDFYDPNAQIKWNITKNLPRSTRGRGTKIVDSDTDEDESDDLSLSGLNYNQEDLKEIDSVREYEVQDALRRACGVGHSNHVIESHWRAGTRDIPESEKENNAQNVENDLDAKIIENTKQNVNSKPESSNDEKENALKPTKEMKDSNSHSNTEVRRNGLSRRTTYVRRPNTEIGDHQISSVASSQTSSQEEDIVVHSAEISTKEKPIDDMNNIYEYYSDSSDENIILESRDLDDITNLFANLNNNTNDKRKTNRKKYKAVDIDVKLPTQLPSTLVHNEYTKIPTKPISFTNALTVQSVLNPNAKEFYSSFSYNRDDSFKLGSEKDFPPLS
ncbi:uncharacterized protein LOC123295207 [Chrysoperla carnea]|uniref:uncharacterized protein LOC123295207 n=1 Tax=Chrysoperla carnea TaxID=189513 RepID=UPI001D080423|nr:uncharacterized protein LOC123295207 [Chrysoperla carnea]